MEYKYKNLVVNLPFEIIGIIDFDFKEYMSEHTYLYMECIIDNDKLDSYVFDIKSNTTITLSEYNRHHNRDLLFFIGKILNSHLDFNGSLHVLKLNIVSFSHDYDIAIKSRTFANLQDTYNDLFQQIFDYTSKSPFFDKVIAGQDVIAQTMKKRFILQYEETDWEFSKRLASHFNTFVFCDSMADYGRFYIGIPRLNYNTVINKQNFTLTRNNILHEVLASRIENTLVEDVVSWEITDENRLYIGEQLLFNDMKCVVIGIHIYLYEEDLLYIYTIQRDGSIKKPFKYNEKIYGMSIPSIVKERNGNTVKVHFSIDDKYEKHTTDKNFVYNIESMDWYCMPEEGSKAHIHFPTNDEADAYATHAVRIATEKEKYHGRAVNPPDKSFSNVDGAEMKMTPQDISFAPDPEKKIKLQLGKDGVVSVTGTNIDIKANTTNIEIGQKEVAGMSAEAIEKLVVPKEVKIYGKDKVTIKRNDGHIIEITQDNTRFQAIKIVKKGVETVVESYEAEVAELTKNDAVLLEKAESISEKTILNTLNEAKKVFSENFSIINPSYLQNMIAVDSLIPYINPEQGFINEINADGEIEKINGPLLDNAYDYLKDLPLKDISKEKLLNDYFGMKLLEEDRVNVPADDPVANLTCGDLFDQLHISKNDFEELGYDFLNDLPYLIGDALISLGQSTVSDLSQPSYQTDAECQIQQLQEAKGQLGVNASFITEKEFQEINKMLDERIAEYTAKIPEERQQIITGETVLTDEYQDSVNKRNIDEFHKNRQAPTSKDPFEQIQLQSDFDINKVNEERERCIEEYQDYIDNGVYINSDIIDGKLNLYNRKIGEIRSATNIAINDEKIKQGISMTKDESSVQNKITQITNNTNYSIEETKENKGYMQNYYDSIRASGGTVDPNMEKKILDSYDETINLLLQNQKEEIEALTNPDYIPPEQRHGRNLENAELDAYRLLNESNKDLNYQMAENKNAMVDSYYNISKGKSIAVE